MRDGFSIFTTLMAMALTASLTTPSWGQNPPAPPPLNAKMQETLMGPWTGNMAMAMSEDGDHMAIAIPKGSRQAVLIDGVEGPVFDEIPRLFLNKQALIQFSPTGGHSAYVARRGGDFIAVIDGKEAGVLGTRQMQQMVAYTQTASWMFWFNRDGSRIAYAAVVDPPGWVMVTDGVKGPPYRDIDFRQTVMNGKRFIYVAQTADMLWHAVVDGKPGPGYSGITSLTVTQDGAHYAYIAWQPSAGGATAAVVVDGVEGKFYFGVSELELAPDGRVAYVATTNRGDGDRRGGEAVLIVDGVIATRATAGAPFAPQFANTIRPSFRSPHRRVAWSPDGRRYAYSQSNTPNPGVTVMVNGKPMGLTYGFVDELMWSSDGSRFAYQATSPTGTFVIVDGQELPFTNPSEFQFSPDGKRYAFRAGTSVVVDGKELTKSISVINGSLRFSANSKHVAYGGQARTANFLPFLDGVAKPAFLGSFTSITLVQPAIDFPVLLFSPDGNRLAFQGGSVTGTGRGAVFVDDVSYVGSQGGYGCPSFSPDSKRFATLIATGQGSAVMIDGKVGPFFESMFALNGNACRFVDDHTFRYYVSKPSQSNQIYRVTLDLR